MRNVTRQRLLVVTYALFTVVSNSYAKMTGGEVAEKGGNPEMEVAGLDICVSVCLSIKNPNPCQKNHTSQIENT